MTDGGQASIFITLGHGTGLSLGINNVGALILVHDNERQKPNILIGMADLGLLQAIQNAAERLKIHV